VRWFVIRLVNLTPHKVRILMRKGEYIELKPEDRPVRCYEDKRDSGDLVISSGLDVVPLKEIRDENLNYIPREKSGVGYIVSKISGKLIARKTNRRDFYISDDLIEKNGNIIGCKSLSRYVDLK